MCQFENNVETMTFSNCDLFKRSFTNKGLGFTFNNELEEKLIKKDYRSKVLFHNNHRIPALMKSASSEHSLRVVIENNAEEVLRYERDKTNFKLKPRTITITLHNPKEVADVRSGSFKVPLGYTTIVYITPKARAIDKSGRELTESERNCRLNEDTTMLNIFNVYTKASCMFECKMKHSMKRCGCQPWNYPLTMSNKV